MASLAGRGQGGSRTLLRTLECQAAYFVSFPKSNLAQFVSTNFLIRPDLPTECTISELSQSWVSLRGIKRLAGPLAGE